MHCVFTDSGLEDNIHKSNMFIQKYHMTELCPSLFAYLFFLNLRLLVSCHAIVTPSPVQAAHVGKNLL